MRKQNHWFDALHNACVAGHICGMRLVEEVKKPKERLTLRQMKDAADRPTARELAEQSWIDRRKWRHW